MMNGRLALGRMIASLFVITVLLGTRGVLAQDPQPETGDFIIEPDPPIKQPEPAEVGNQVANNNLVDYYDDKTFWMGIVVLTFGLAVIVVQSWSYRSKTAKISGSAQMRYMVVLVVIIATLFTVVTGLGSQTVAPAMGLFGTIVGYLLGTGRERQKSPPSDETQNDDRA